MVEWKIVSSTENRSFKCSKIELLPHVLVVSVWKFKKMTSLMIIPFKIISKLSSCTALKLLDSLDQQRRFRQNIFITFRFDTFFFFVLFNCFSSDGPRRRRSKEKIFCLIEKETKKKVSLRRQIWMRIDVVPWVRQLAMQTIEQKKFVLVAIVRQRYILRRQDTWLTRETSF